MSDDLVERKPNLKHKLQPLDKTPRSTNDKGADALNTKIGEDDDKQGGRQS